ncbi:MAG: DNA mismatch repair endonuclease MutL, partial [Anaerolineales bacterium]|nr:DNA mismatch repair endonuclease MutL [Anaerolineales bacterium]
MPIKQLPPDVASKIAAGEVVERPASVVKELVENAIDAGATEIRVDVKGGGVTLIRVSDNGAGIPDDELTLAFAHHATSKLASADDLFALHTLGFRGEALPSIAAVSEVTVLSRPREAREGTQLRIEGGHEVARQPRGAPAGTIFTVENLFFNVPARRKFLRTTATENSAISAIVSTYALAYPERRFSLTVEQRQSLQSPGSGGLEDAIIAVYGVEMAKEMIELPPTEDSESGVVVDGFIGGPALHRPNRKYITIFVNGRAVSNSMVQKAIEQAYQGVVPTGRFPVVVVRIQLPPDAVDVNVHPQKQEVKFARSDEVFRAVQRAIRRRLIEAAPVHSYGRPSEPIGESGAEAAAPTGDWRRFDRSAYSGTGGAGERGEAMPPPAPTRPPTTEGRRDAAYWTQQAAARPSPPDVAPTDEEQLGFGDELRPDGTGYYDVAGSSRLPPLRVLGQIHKTFIVCEGPDGLYLVDQHTAHERVLLERFQTLRAEKRVPAQALLAPLTLELTPHQLALVEEQQAALLQLGFEIEPFGGLMVVVRSIPKAL